VERSDRNNPGKLRREADLRAERGAIRRRRARPPGEAV